MSAGGETEGEGQANSILGAEPNLGLISRHLEIIT